MFTHRHCHTSAKRNTNSKIVSGVRSGMSFTFLKNIFASLHDCRQTPTHTRDHARHVSVQNKVKWMF